MTLTGEQRTGSGCSEDRQRSRTRTTYVVVGDLGESFGPSRALAGTFDLLGGATEQVDRVLGKTQKLSRAPRSVGFALNRSLWEWKGYRNPSGPGLTILINVPHSFNSSPNQRDVPTAEERLKPGKSGVYDILAAHASA